LQTFIVVPGVQKCENSLRQANRTVDQELNDAIVAKQQAEDTLEKLWKAEGSSGKGYLEWAKEKIKEKPHDLEAVVSGADQILTALRDAIGTRNQLDTDKLEESERETELQEAQKALKDAETDGTEQDSALIAVLQDAKTFLEGYESASEKVFFNSIFPL